MSDTPQWSALYRSRRRMAARFGSIWSLPVRKRARDVLLAHVAPGARVLEVGAGDRRLGKRLEADRPGCVYRSMDVDPAGGHDYTSLDEIDETFDCVFAIEVIEHLSFEDAWRMLVRIGDLCRAGGRLVLATPNTYRPQAFLRDATHRTPFAWDELAGLTSLAGFEVLELVRIYNAPVQRQLAHRVLFYWVHRLVGIDYARTIVLVAQRPEADGKDARRTAPACDIPGNAGDE